MHGDSTLKCTSLVLETARPNTNMTVLHTVCPAQTAHNLKADFNSSAPNAAFHLMLHVSKTGHQLTPFHTCTIAGVSSWEGRKTGKQADTSVPSPEPTSRPSKERKRRTGGGVSSRVKRQRAVCILVPLAILLVLGGIGAAIGITMSQQRAALAQTPPAAAEAEPPPPPPTPGPPLVFKVNITVPPSADGEPGPSCSDLVGPRSGKGKMEVGVMLLVSNG